MAVRGSLAPGYDFRYAERAAASGAPMRAGEYYTRSYEHGEPPGRWAGKGATALGFEQHQVVDKDVYLQVFGERLDPRDGTRLGRRPAAGDVEKLYQRLLDAEPHATAERKAELYREAAQNARQTPYYFDLTSSFSKSISVFYASVGENYR